MWYIRISLCAFHAKLSDMSSILNIESKMGTYLYPLSCPLIALKGTNKSWLYSNWHHFHSEQSPQPQLQKVWDKR
jgi:hypothetical protein